LVSSPRKPLDHAERIRVVDRFAEDAHLRIDDHGVGDENGPRRPRGGFLHGPELDLVTRSR
jgi:hypothetical protein